MSPAILSLQSACTLCLFINRFPTKRKSTRTQFRARDATGVCLQTPAAFSEEKEDQDVDSICTVCRQDAPEVNF